MIWFCEILCYIFPHVERALVFWNLVLYFSAGGTRSGIVEFLIVFFRLCCVRVVCVFYKNI